MHVNGAECTPELDDLQQRIETSVEALGYRAHVLSGITVWAVTEGLDSHGGFAGPFKFSVVGLTSCEGATVSVALAPGAPWYTTSLSHEAFHLAQKCVDSAQVYADCRDLNELRLDPVALDRQCLIRSMHPHWEDTIYPAINQVNADAERGR